jgi:hypothetical protein
MTHVKQEGIYQTGISKVIVYLTNGGIIDSHEVDSIGTIIDESGQSWFEINYDTKNFFDSLSIPLENVLYFKTTYPKEKV